MTKQEKKTIRKVYSILQILREETDKFYLREEIDRLSKELLKSLDD